VEHGRLTAGTHAVSRPPTLIVIPTLNERENIAELLAGIREHAPGTDVLLVDDGSTDGTPDLARERGAHVLQRGRRLGIGSAYQVGFAWGLERPYAQFVSMDGDLSHEPRYLPALMDAMADTDLAIGSRYVKGISVVNWDLKRLTLSVVANRYARMVTGLPVNDCTSGYQCFRREVMARIDVASLHCTGYSFLVELKYRAHRLGFRLREVPIIFVDRRGGSSKLGPSHVLQSAWNVSSLRLFAR
jgi:dolichol-phosphate mannosyltransferase